MQDVFRQGCYMHKSCPSWGCYFVDASTEKAIWQPCLSLFALSAFCFFQDVYTGVAEEVQKIAEADAKDGVLAAQALLGNITRKLVKQTVMTSVYGVTSIGAREQIQVTPVDIVATCLISLCSVVIKS